MIQVQTPNPLTAHFGVFERGTQFGQRVERDNTVAQDTRLGDRGK